jgi:hypothetical protein
MLLRLREEGDDEKVRERRREEGGDLIMLSLDLILMVLRSS